MKKQFLLIMLSIMLLLSGCGSKKDSGNGAGEQNNESQESSETVTVDESLMNVTITLPNSFFEDFLDTSAEEYVASLGENSNAFKNAVVNEDGSVSVTMSKKEYNEYMTELGKSIDDSIKELIDDESNSFVSVDHDKKYETFTVKLSTDEIGLGESFMAIGFVMFGGIYQMFDGNQKPHIIVKYVGPNGTELQTFDSNNMGNE